MITLGIISDTHIPDRPRALNSCLLSIFKDARVSAILHAGDVCTPLVLQQLGEIAPVHAVRGNRDWVRLRHLLPVQTLEFGGVVIGLSHGHGGLYSYILDKAHHMLSGVQEQRFIERALVVSPSAKVIVFGHIHIAINKWLDGRLLFNPGSSCCPHYPQDPPTVGLLHITSPENVRAEIIPLR